LGVAVVAAILGVLAAKFLLGHTYAAYSVIVYEGSPDIAGLPSRGRFEFETLVSEVRLPENLRKATKRLDLGIPVHAAGNLVQVGYAHNSNLVNVSAREASPEAAARFANTVVDVFLEHRLTVEKARIAEHLETIERDLQLARDNAAKAQAAYDRFREEHGISNLSAETEQAIAAAASLQAQADLARAEAQAEEVRSTQLAAAQRRIGTTTVLSERRNSPVDQEMIRVRAELAQARSSLSDEHPRVQALQQQVATLRAQSRNVKQSVSDRMVGINPAYQAVRESAADSRANQQAAQEREAALNRLVEQARQRVAQLSRVDGEASRLLAAVRVASDHVTRLEAQRVPVEDELRAPSTGFRIAERAVPPDVPMSSRKKLVVAGASPLAAMMLLLVVFMYRELKGLRVATATEVSFWGQGPVIGSTVWPRDPEALSDFIGELDDYAPAVSGRTLVLGATVGAIPLAGVIARALRETVTASEVTPKGDDEFEPAGYLMPGGGSFVEDTVAMTPEAMNIPLASQGDDSWSGESPRPASAEVSRAIATHTVSLASLGQFPGEQTAMAKDQDLPLFEVSVYAAVDPTSAVEAWDGPEAGPPLRRAARLADRVLVVVPSGTTSALDLRQIPARLGRTEGIGYAVVDMAPCYAGRPDRAGEVDAFWYSYRE
jgi:uncharacterized protein involved in exopolysaccharide biosynthesis